MKKIICLLILLALSPGVHAGDKKKKKPDSGNAPAAAPGGGGGQRGGGGLPGMSRSAGPTSARQGAPRQNRPTAPSLNSRTSSAGHAPKSNSPTGAISAPASHNNSNPLLRKSGQAKAKQPGTNPLTQSNRQAGAGKANPLAKKNNAQPNLNGRNGNPLANKNNPNLGRNREALAQTGRGVNKRVGTRNWQQGSHANYRVRPAREVFHNYRPLRHDRGWYTSRYDRVLIVGGGYYYWDAGYWYPAWGYDPAISFYVYDGPIYSYDNLPPDQVTMNVQTALQDEGYYTGEIDGLVGPRTRDALGAYQTDHNLEITSAVDEPTVEALGLSS